MDVITYRGKRVPLYSVALRRLPGTDRYRLTFYGTRKNFKVTFTTNELRRFAAATNDILVDNTGRIVLGRPER